MNICDSLRGNLLYMLQTSKDYQQSLKFMCIASVPRMMFLDKYKSLPPIEAYSPDEKKEWKLFVNEIFPGTPPTFRLEAVKIIYTIGIMTSE